MAAANYKCNRACLVGKSEGKIGLEGDLVLPGWTGRVGGRPSLYRYTEGSKVLTRTQPTLDRADVRPKDPANFGPWGPKLAGSQSV